MDYNRFKQQHQLEKLLQRRLVNLHATSIHMQREHHERMFIHVSKVELAYAALDARLSEIRKSIDKLAAKPRWRFWA